MWSVPMYNNPRQISSLEMVLVDEHGGKIQATVRRALLYRFSPLIEEGCVYKMAYFTVVPNSGHYKATLHEFKLVFLYKTSVVKMECDSIPMFGLSLVSFADVLRCDDDYDHLIDVMGLLTYVMPERQYEKDGKVTTMVVMEITDPTGKLECALFGEYVDQLRQFLGGGKNVQVIVVVQLARVKTFRGKTVIQNSMNATRLLFDPDIPEAISFRNSIAEHGVIDVEPLAVVLDNSREGLESDFMKLHPRKTVSELNSVNKGGIFIIVANIVEIVNDGAWYYLACKCNRAVTMQSNLHFCEHCRIPVLQVCPRFKVKIEVSDEVDTAVFVVFDRDMNFLLGKTCEELLTGSFQDAAEFGCPPILASLVGQRMLFKVETKADEAVQFGGSYAVRRVCVDDDIIALFDLPGADLTPSKAIFAPPFPSTSTDMEALQHPFIGSQSDAVVETISLDDDEVGDGFRCTFRKRKLEADFDSCQGISSDCGKTSVGAVEVEEGSIPMYDFVPVKIEKE